MAKNTPAAAAGGIGTETVPGASGTGAEFEKREAQMEKDADKAAERRPQPPASPSTSPQPPVADRPESKEAEKVRRETSKRHSADVARQAEGSTARDPRNIRTEFGNAPGRFPSEVAAMTDPPLEDVIAGSPGVAVPYVGEFKGDGSFSRQPSLDRENYPGTGLVDDKSTEGRPAPAPDTPGERGREFPAPSEADKTRLDTTARNLEAAKTRADEGK